MNDDIPNTDSPFGMSPNADQSRDNILLVMVQSVTRLVVLFSLYSLIYYLLRVVCFAWQEMGPPIRYPGIKGIPLLLRIPEVVINFVILKGALNCTALSEKGRQWLVAGSLATLIVFPPIRVVQGIYYNYAVHSVSYGIPFAISNFGEYLLGGLGGCIWPFFVWRFYRREEVKALFGSPSNRVPRQVADAIVSGA